EYTALAVAGAIDPIDAVRLVAARGRFMQQACDARPGAMASVLGLAPEQVEQVVAELSSAEAPLVVSNYNSPRQTVISGAAEAVERAIEPLRARGARRVVPLRVAGAYHSPLMAPAAERLAEQLEQVEIRAPRWPVFSNVTGAPHGEPDEIRRLLAEQVCRPVRWTDTMRGMREAGLEQFYELGPGRALAGMLRQIDRGAKCASLMEWEDFERMGWTWPAGSI
ncbi:MAG: ACP S-malonyltransferase, partial [Planctomycetota bacterium]